MKIVLLHHDNGFSKISLIAVLFFVVVSKYFDSLRIQDTGNTAKICSDNMYFLLKSILKQSKVAVLLLIVISLSTYTFNGVVLLLSKLRILALFSYKTS